ncbi:MAG TPA: tRNA (adenosine(37)-N6)-threonylcarbamoyltransferase complex transferase subunit TsaD [Hyphomicrobiaceae bacterium]|jgi:N6-L-threonylcarbamoyladenine synthase|nr:tRNA (adenosine(37)-N6)-threonylcarbamoyltransferase complex transferase subunit TsaD [Hyphomicrobiaceae bacterium]
MEPRADAATLARDQRETLVLGIETSCDETAAAVIARTPDGTGRIRSNVVRGQWEEHRRYGGVVPEIAARAHAECLDEIVALALSDADVDLAGLDAVAVTAGPGLIGGLLVGVTTAKALALVHRLPLVAVNHLAAHALTVGLTEGLRPPYLLLLVSGGHTQLLIVHGVGRYERLGTTIDDALGEAFDKTAKLLGLGFPGGPAVERAAAAGRAGRFALPRPMIGRAEPHFSFAGLKTAVRRRAQQAQALAPLSDRDIADLCAEFQAAVCESLADRVLRAMAIADVRLGSDRHLVVAGGVAANRQIHRALTEAAAARGWRLHVPPPQLCTDNGAMIAWAGAERLALGLTDGLDFEARARWPLDAQAIPALGGGRHGAKA